MDLALSSTHSDDLFRVTVSHPADDLTREVHDALAEPPRTTKLNLDFRALGPLKEKLRAGAGELEDRLVIVPDPPDFFGPGKNTVDQEVMDSGEVLAVVNEDPFGKVILCSCSNVVDPNIKSNLLDAS